MFAGILVYNFGAFMVAFANRFKLEPGYLRGPKGTFPPSFAQYRVQFSGG